MHTGCNGKRTGEPGTIGGHDNRNCSIECAGINSGHVASEVVNGFHDTGLLETQSQRAQNWNQRFREALCFKALTMVIV